MSEVGIAAAAAAAAAAATAHLVVDPLVPGPPPPEDAEAPPVVVPPPPISAASPVLLPLEDFAEDLEVRLGRANGNVYQRHTGVEGVHDGQVMVRLKKKRFIVIDYSIVPTASDLQAVSFNPHVHIPLGAGRTTCTGKIPASGGVAGGGGAPVLIPCPKVGVPVLLYDSEPQEPASLYLRSGLCFTCQRNLNEKRRTQRKKPHEKAAAKAAKLAKQQLAAATKQQQQQQQRGPTGVSDPHVLYSYKQQLLAQQQASPAVTVGADGGFQPQPPPPPPPSHLTSTMLKLAAGPSTVSSSSGHRVHILGGGLGGDASTMLIGAGSTGRVNATPHSRVLMAVTHGHKKIKLAHTTQPLILAPEAIILNGPPDDPTGATAPCKSVRLGHGYAEIGIDLQYTSHQAVQTLQTMLHSVDRGDGLPTSTPPTPEEFSRQYDATFCALAKSLYLLTQWKTSWDTASSTTAVAHDAVTHAAQLAVANANAQAIAMTAQMHEQAASAAAAAVANAAATAAIGVPYAGVPLAMQQHQDHQQQVAAVTAAATVVGGPHATVAEDATTIDDTETAAAAAAAAASMDDSGDEDVAVDADTPMPAAAATAEHDVGTAAAGTHHKRQRVVKKAATDEDDNTVEV